MAVPIWQFRQLIQIFCVMIVPLSPYSPKRVNGYVQPLLDYLGLEARAAVLLRVSLSHGFTPEADNCHLNVWCQLRLLGGGVQHGWHLVQDPRHKFSEAIFHTVWRSETGELRDLTPRQDGEKKIMFVPDDTRAIELSNYNGSPAINTFASVKVVAGEVIEPLQPIKLVMQSDFAQRNGLWPW